jgi:hypothetical protein
MVTCKPAAPFKLSPLTTSNAAGFEKFLSPRRKARICDFQKRTFPLSEVDGRLRQTGGVSLAAAGFAKRQLPFTVTRAVSRI